jgi:hypothetical protein
VIHPEFLARERDTRPAIANAFSSWAIFVTSLVKPSLIGEGMVPLTHKVLASDFLSRLLHAGGTEQDIQWLLNHGVMVESDRPVWDEVVDLYIKRSVR